VPNIEDRLFHLRLNFFRSQSTAFLIIGVIPMGQIDGLELPHWLGSLAVMDYRSAKEIICKVP